MSDKVTDEQMDEDKCTCKENECTSVLCKGECGCIKCHDDYQDFLSYDYE